MKLYLFILLSLCIPMKLSNAEIRNPKLDEYLERQSKILREQLVKRIRSIRGLDVKNDEEPDILGSYQHRRESYDTNINIFTFFNKTFFAINDEMFHGTLRKSFNMEFYGNFEHRIPIFFKAFEYLKTGFIALSTKKEIFMYTFTEIQTSPELIQTISTPYSSDGIFFVNSGNLYFVSSTNQGEHIGLITLYKWLGSHFDEIETLHNTGVVKMGSFAHRLSEIIIMERSLPRGPRVLSSVYEFKQDKIRKIQHLNTYKPTHMDIFFQNDVPYVLIYEEMKSQKFYKWNGFEMVLVNRFQWGHKVGKSIVVYSNTIPLIVQPQLDKVLVFKPQNEDIRLHKTKGYLANYSVILDINIGENENGNITFIAGLNEDNIINIYGMSFKAHDEMEREQEGALRNCFINLEKKLYDRKKKLNQMSDHMTPKKRQATLSSTNPGGTGIENELDEVKRRLNKIRFNLATHGGSPNQLVVNGKAIIKGGIVTKKVNANKLNLKAVNGKNWTPEQWLRYNQEQIVTGAVKLREINSRILVTNATIFQTILRNNGNQTILGNFKINKLSSSKMFSKIINNVEVDNIYQSSDSSNIKGLKSFDNVLTKKADINKINGNKTEDVLSRLQNTDLKANMKFAPYVNITNMYVESIDGINWPSFENSVFKIGEDDTIKGNLIVPGMKGTYLLAKTLNGIDTDNFMTKSTDQTINSTIEFNNIEAPTIECGTVNDIDINKSVQTDQNGTIIKGHVEIKEVNVSHDLTLIGEADKSPFEKYGDHIFGTNPSDLLQIYLGKVVVNGNLYVNDFSTLHNSTILLRGKQFNIDMLDSYWNKNGNQIIPVHFEAINGISTPDLKTKFLNEISIEKFVLNHKKSQIKGPLFFENITVEGNVHLKKGSSFDLEKLANEGVRADDGLTYNIKGKKQFKNTLVVQNLEAQKNFKQNIKSALPGKKLLKKIIIKGDLASNINTESVNKINISKYMKRVLPLDKPQNLTNLALKKITVENLHVETINGNRIEEYLNKLRNILENKQISRVNIKGNLTMQQAHDLRYINGQDISNLSEEAISQTDAGADLIGNVKFARKVKIGNLRTRTINEIDFPDLTKRFLHKKSNQTVTGIYSFTKLKTVHLYAKKINEKNMDNLIDISKNKTQQLSVPYGIAFKNINLETSVSAEEMVPCDINKAMTNIRYPESQEWAVVEISGNVTFLDENCDVLRILEKSVKSDEENTISAPVVIKGHASTERMKIYGNLNDVNLAELIEDAVLSDSNEVQIITGHKIFNNVIDAVDVTVIENADIPIVNNIAISALYEKIIRKDQVNNITIMGKKTFFGGLQSNTFLTAQIAGINPDNIVSLTSSKQIPNAIFDTINVTNDLNVKFINSYELNYVLNNRIFTNTSQKQITNAVYYFNDLEIRDNLKTMAINNIQIENIVFDMEKQKISAPKRFLQNVTVFGNLSIGNLNGINVTEQFNNAVLHGNKEIINGSITILNPVRLEGNITAQTINGYPIEEIKGIMNQASNKAEEEIILRIRERLKKIVQDTLPIVKHIPNEFMYIERSDRKLDIQNAIDANVVVIKDYALIHVLSEESHEKCNLPEGCKCPVHHTVEITPHLSINSFLNKGQQRVYSYDDESLTIHLITNSISIDTKCRTNKTGENNEVSTMTWSTATTGNTTGTFNVHPIFFTGYVSGAEFFSLNGATYAIIARYYDHVTDTHDLDCIVMRFNDEKTSASVLQKIPTRGAWTLYLLHTAQGITIVIGNLAKEPYTEIYRFNQRMEQFELLRSVSYGCTKAVGVVLGTDSLIILANNEAPLQVLKYHPNWDNYYYYQMFALEEPVLGMSVFYVGGFGISDAYLCIVTEENYRIYSFQYIDGWKLESRGAIRGLRNLIPFELNEQLYLLAPSTSDSSLFTVVKHGTGEV